MPKRRTYYGRQRYAPYKKRIKAKLSKFRYKAPPKKRSRPTLPEETKYFDTSYAAVTLTAPTDCTGAEHDPTTILCLNGVPQGDTQSSRDGFMISQKSIFLNGTITAAAQVDQTAIDHVPTVFVALVLDTQTNLAQLNSEDVFSNPSGNGGLATAPLRNMSYTSRFKVLKSKIVRIPVPMASWDGTNIEQAGITVNWSMSCPLNGLITKFTAGTTTGYIGTVVDNSLHVVAFVNYNTSLTCQLNYNARLRFVG